MRKSVIVISTLVNQSIQEFQPDVNFTIFTSLKGLQEYVNENPLHAEELIFTRDAIPYYNESLSLLVKLIKDHPFLHVEKVTYITEEDSPELKSIDFIIKDENLENWEIIKGALTREFVDGVINGTQRKDDFEAKRKIVYRVPRAEYVKERGKKQLESLEEEYEPDDLQLVGIPDEEPPAEIIPESEEVCQLIHIAGRDEDTIRTLFTFIAGQYLATYGKTIIVERDVMFHQLTEYATKSNASYCLIEISEIFDDINEVLHRIRTTPSKLVIVGAIERVSYSYSFIVQLLYNNLYKSVRYFLREDSLAEAPLSSKFVAVIRNTVVDSLRLCSEMDTLIVPYANVVAVNTDTILEEKYKVSKQMKLVIQDIMGSAPETITFVTISSLTLKDNPGCDLRSILL